MWFLNIWDSTPSIASLKPIRQGANSVVFAADGSRLGYVQSDTIRRPVHGSKIPSDLKNATVAMMIGVATIAAIVKHIVVKIWDTVAAMESVMIATRVVVGLATTIRANARTMTMKNGAS